MRIIAGTLGGRIFDSPHGNRTHPMSDKIRGALFNALGDLTGQTVLDAFAGTGALSFEAVSRGATEVIALDIDKQAYETIVANVEKLDLSEKVIAMRKNAGGWSRNNQHKQFDVVLADPPYNDIRPNVIERLTRQTKLQGVFVLSWPGREPIRPFADMEVILTKSYGDAQLVFYRRIK
jgi:16S rRNA (guanine966-N2)-methyltransferase